MFSLARLLPREEKFYSYIRKLCDECVTSAGHLETLVGTESPARRKDAAAAIIACKAQAKILQAEVTRELCLTFVTPFDREDIQDFCSELYKITKTIDKTREYLDLHNITETQELAAQAALIVQDARGMDSMVRALISGGKLKQIMALAEELDALENKGDAVLSGLLVKLMKDTTDARQMIIRKDVYDPLERVIDRYRDAAGIALQIALKHS
jgi:uncharacterized protein Yka (UPF0111/DUF47 family)